MANTFDPAFRSSMKRNLLSMEREFYDNLETEWQNWLDKTPSKTDGEIFKDASLILTTLLSDANNTNRNVFEKLMNDLEIRFVRHKVLNLANRALYSDKEQ